MSVVTTILMTTGILDAQMLASVNHHTTEIPLAHKSENPGR